MEKIDLKKQLKPLYSPPSNRVVEVEVPTMNFLMIDGSGDPNSSQAYAHAVEALFAVAYALKFMVKRGPQAVDYVVMPLEGLWWSADISTFSVDRKAEWLWTMMIMQPGVVTTPMVTDAIDQVRRKKGLSAVDAIRFVPFHEGRCAQILHRGPFSEEGPTIARLHEHIAQQGSLRGKHHEIYLSDIRRAAPANWKTIIRQPF
ncbi:MAG: GyrI-like domain-containing protein [Anaerolineales bacterium]|nr:GyrI-like domain-containing protein [Anaerolineales bacterium]MCB9129045.1 GyrI-like domain-containing protein [Ardenticatenales bacterium]MCB9172468.1 GyrI-like domain-containing protein [Ardenticatenales bacterium]